jgi:hypothetical protein
MLISIFIAPSQKKSKDTPSHANKLPFPIIKSGIFAPHQSASLRPASAHYSQAKSTGSLLIELAVRRKNITINRLLWGFLDKFRVKNFIMQKNLPTKESIFVCC